MKYNVTILRTSFRSHTFEVTADSEDGAATEAMDKAASANWNDFSCGGGDYEVESIEEANVKTRKKKK